MFLIVLTVAFFSPFYVRVYVCVRGHARAYMFGSGVSWHTPVVCRECGRCSFRYIYIVLTSPLQKLYLPTHLQENIKIATAYNYEDTQLEVELALKTAVVKELHDT